MGNWEGGPQRMLQWEKRLCKEDGGIVLLDRLFNIKIQLNILNRINNI